MLQLNYRCAIVGSQAQYKYQQLKKKTLVGDFGVMRDEIYIKIKVQEYNVSKKKYKDKIWKTIKIQRPQNGFYLLYILFFTLHLFSF